MDKNWKKLAKENYKALEDVDPEAATKDQYLLFAASVALLDHFEYKDKDIHSEDENALQGKTEGKEETLLSHAEDEVSDAEMYYRYWTDTKDPKFLEISKQELDHCEYWVKLARESGIQESKLKDIITRHNVLMARYS